MALDRRSGNGQSRRKRNFFPGILYQSNFKFIVCVKKTRGNSRVRPSYLKKIPSGQVSTTSDDDFFPCLINCRSRDQAAL